jgi:hypothetical protein
MECKHIRERLPAYREEDVDLEEKKAIGQHLSSCQKCSQALDDLKKAEELVKRLPEVEPPAWMTQKVMARVRAEEEKRKGIVQHLFFPLRIKIPIEVFATVLIAVAAIYVFKAVEPQMKPVGLPSAPEQGIAKEESVEPSPGTGRAGAAGADFQAPESKVAVQKPAKPAEKEKGARSADERSRDSLEEEKRFGAESKEGLSVVAADKSLPAEPRSQPTSTKKSESLQDRVERPARVSPSPSQETLPPRQIPAEVSARQKEPLAEKDVLAGEVHMSKTLAAPAALKAAPKEARQVGVTIHVGDIKSASGEIQGLLRRLGARRVEHESLQNAEILTTELQAEKLKELFEALKPIGDVKEKGGIPDISQGEIARIRIEVISQP